MRKTIVLLASLLIVSGFAEMSTGRNLPQAQKQTIQSKQQIKTTIAKLNHAIDVWHNAILKGNKKQSFLFETKIRTIMGEDLQSSREVVRFYAKKTTISGKSDVTRKRAHPQSRGKAFGIALSNYNTKEQLSLSFSRTKAFSNKYRLVSDYLDLLRKQLKMTPLKYAKK